MIYFFVGSDNESKDKKISDLKKKVLPSVDAITLDYQVLYAQKLEAKTLKKALISLPAISKKRMVVIRDSQKLSASHKKIIVDIFCHADAPCEVILDYNGKVDKKFLEEVQQSADVSYFRKKSEATSFDLADFIAMRRNIDALKVLSDLLEKGDHPLQIIGGLVWSWSKLRDKISAEKFRKGLLVFQEADVNIKRSRLKSEYALELLVVKLCSL